MDRIWHILAGIALIYGAYVLLLKRWDYTSQAKRQEQKERLKKEGLATAYFFIPPARLLWLNAMSGGLFFFYWSYKQWRAILYGYKNTDKKPLTGGAFFRALFGWVFFYQMAAIVNRTCAYMHKPQTLTHYFWGSVLLGGALAAGMVFLPFWGRILGGVCFLIPPFFIQKHINFLPKELPAVPLRFREWVWVPLGWICWGGIFILLQHL